MINFSRTVSLSCSNPVYGLSNFFKEKALPPFNNGQVMAMKADPVPKPNDILVLLSGNHYDPAFFVAS
jgi:hypothetical protein